MELSVATEVAIPMRDGVVLVADVYRPAGEGRHPVVLLRTPYSRRAGVTPTEAVEFVTAGYAVVAQDVRGRFASGGTFVPFVHERSDGEDTLRWIVAQPFSDGTVAMAGASYVAATQWLVAAGDAPSLRAIAPNITGSSYHDGWTYEGGAFHLGFALSWTLGNLALADAATAVARGDRPASDVDQVVAALDDIEQHFRRTPVAGWTAPAELAPYYQDWVSRPDEDDTWRATAPREHYADVTVPSLNIGGWYDCFLRGTLENYIGMRASALPHVAAATRLIIGPWSHGTAGGEYAARSYGVRASSDVMGLTGERIRFFDRHLRGLDGLDAPPVRLFVMGADVWRDEADWPLPDTSYEPFFLHSDGDAAADGGLLSPTAPADQPADHFTYDPRDPVPTVGGQTFLPGIKISANGGPRDRRAVEARPDVLTYTTPPLTSDLEVTGPVSAVLHVSTSVRDTDVTAALLDVHPDGSSIILTEGILRARYRDSLADPTLLMPGEVYELTVDLWATSNLFRAGHRIRLDVSSSNFPRFDRNSNTGGVVAQESESDVVVAHTTIHHDAVRPSRLVLPVVRRGTPDRGER
jgi:putative CocE/NonD family hydrolase